MTQATKTLLTAGVIALSAIVLCLMYCHEPKHTHASNFTLDSTKNIEKYKQSLLSKEIATAQRIDTILVTKWRFAKSETDSIFKFVYLNVPIECKDEIARVDSAYEIERNDAIKVIASKDSIITLKTEYITSLQSVAVVDSITISILQTDTTILRKQVKKLGKRNRIAFGLGYVLGLGTGVIINKLK